MAKAKPTSGSDIWSRQNILDFAPDEASIPAAEKVLKKGGFGTVETTADGKGWWVVCQGITDIYQVSVRIDEGIFQCECTCPSPKYPCKHALALLLYLSEHPEERAEPEAPKYAPSDFEALVRSVFQNPEDDTPRLVFADFLEENNEPDRAALIRLQCELAREKARSPRAKELQDQQRRLVAKVRRAVVDPLPEGVSAKFHRGFLHLDMDLYMFPEVGSLPARFTSLFQGGWVEVVRIGGYYFETLREDHATLFGLIAELDFSTHQYMPEEVLLSLAALSTQMREAGRLCRVKIPKQHRKAFDELMAAQRGQEVDGSGGATVPERHCSNLTPQTFDLLRRSGRLRTARRLYLDGPLGDWGAEQLATADLGPVEVLYLTRFDVHEAGLAALGNSAALADVTELAITNSVLSARDIAAFANTSGVGNLRVLRLSNSDLDDAAAAELAKATGLKRVERLDLEWNRLTAKGVGAVLRSANFPALAEVNLTNNAIRPADLLPLLLEAAPRRELSLTLRGLLLQRWCPATGTRVAVTHEYDFREALFDGLARCAAAKDVAALRVERTEVDPAALRSIAASCSPKALRELELRDVRLRNDGVEAFVAAFKDYRLETLRLPFCRVQASGVAALADSPVLASARVLDLSGNTIGKAGAEALAKSPHLDQLERLELSAGKVGTAERQVLTNRFGKRLEL
jgi:uncharacterized protein (TIGR02996 family)